jgi:hypothetical protein
VCGAPLRVAGEAAVAGEREHSGYSFGFRVVSGLSELGPAGWLAGGSVREVRMSPFLRLRYIEELKLTGPDHLLFPTKRDTPRSRQNLNRRVLAPAVARAAQARAAHGDSVVPPALTRTRCAAPS